jgi:fimbrial isopeptide formation D2 family protein/LPXTG-motif cell wall-anchored protein
MTKQLKRIGALALALVFALCLTLPAFATSVEGTSTNTTKGTIKITNTDANVTYEAYRIFGMSTTDTTTEPYTNVTYTLDDQWKDFFFNSNGETQTDYLIDVTTVTTNTEAEANKTDNTEADANKPDYSKCNTLIYNNKQYYIYIVDETDGPSNVAEFAEKALEYVTITKNNALTKADYKTTTAANETVEFKNLDLGYYLIYPRGASQLTSGSASVCSLDSTTPNITVKPKATLPSITKTATTTNKVVEIGSDVDFKITGTVPDTTGYTSYTYTITDTMGDGLEYKQNAQENNNGMTVKILKINDNGDNLELQKGTTLENGNFTLDVNGQTLKLTIDVLNLQDYVGKEIEITYTAKVTEKAQVGNINNKAVLNYSNNPSMDTTGTTENNPEKVDLYTMNVQVYAYTGDKDTSKDQTDYNPGTPLPGAGYKLYMLNDDGTTKKDADGNTLYYHWNSTDSKVEWTKDGDVLITGSNGLTETAATTASDETPAVATLYFRGLGEGKYVLEEVTTPEGYNKAINKEFTVELTNGTPTATDSLLVNKSYQVQYNVQHNSGEVLPSTGGMGTTLFYIIGAALVIGAGVLLVVRRRMGEEE